MGTAIEPNRIYLMDCREGMRLMPDEVGGPDCNGPALRD
ncbi:MAG: hypothetical protein KatS3mg021_0512 [Fimbriimonadales bacterium]|nr:MAG: hypothetical protein KatS3mg021_0512 [Fimbriimonadales bacterium]